MEENFFITDIRYNYLAIAIVPWLILGLIATTIIFKNKLLKGISIIILLFFISEELSYIFYAMSILNGNYKASIKYGKLAAYSAMIPYEKGTKYSHIAILNYINNDYLNAKKNYELAYKYLKTYNNIAFTTTGLLYMNNLNDYDKAITVFEEQNQWSLISQCYILKNDFEKAMIYAQKHIEKFPQKPIGYSLLALIERNRGNEELAKKYYLEAKEKCEYQNQAKMNDEMYNNYKTYFSDKIKR